jgi:hypothetical protein
VPFVQERLQVRFCAEPPGKTLDGVFVSAGVGEEDVIAVCGCRVSLGCHGVPARTTGGVARLHALPIMLCLNEICSGRLHTKRMAEATPFPGPAGSRLVQDRGVLACTLSQVAMLMPTKKPRGQALPMEATRANQALHHHWLRIVPVHRSVKRCRIVKDRIRVWKEGVRTVLALRSSWS